MIYGVIPVGGKGTRLGLPYSKEMLPQKNFDYYNPVINHIVDKMLMAGATLIIFVHGKEYKKDITDYFMSPQHKHILQENLGFANVLRDAQSAIGLNPTDKILFGLPDSVFDDNPFIEMIQKPGIVCGLFTTNNYSKVDRLSALSDTKSFQVKSRKTDANMEWFWGILKFDGSNILKMMEDEAFDRYTEIGHILNMYDWECMHGNRYLDLGTWMNYNRYLSNEVNFSNVEVERKYNANDVSREQFNFLFESDYKKLEIISRDFYFTNDNPNIEFIRYREKGKNKEDGSISDLTIKNFNKSQMNRFELSIPLADQVSTTDVKQYCHLLGLKYEFDVEKDCLIFDADSHTVVYYTFHLGDKQINIIEVELKRMDFNILSSIEDRLCELDGFDIENIINKSKFQMIKEYYDSTH